MAGTPVFLWPPCSQPGAQCLAVLKGGWISEENALERPSSLAEEKGLGRRDQRMKGAATCSGGANYTGARYPKAGEGNKGEETLVEAATSTMEPHRQWQNSVNV